MIMTMIPKVGGLQEQKKKTMINRDNKIDNNKEKTKRQKENAKKKGRHTRTHAHGKSMTRHMMR